MAMIYQPAGKAREYSPLALNLYLGCSHKCKYCYAPKCRLQKEEDYFINPEPRKKVLEELEKQLKKEVPKEQVLLSFIGDVYCETKDNNKLTRDVLQMLLLYKVPVAILTKGGKRCLKDLHIFKQFKEHIQIGATLTFDNDKDSKEWEEGAALPSERLETLKILHQEGIRTFASFEPVIKPEQSINLIKQSIDYIDVYKIGKLNNYKGIDKEIDWNDFLQKAVNILRDAKKPFYIKKDLRENGYKVKLYGNEIISDDFNVN